MRKVYIVGDSHSESMRRANWKIEVPGTQLIWRPFGAVKQGINAHHRRDNDVLHLLENNWRENKIPFEASDRGNPNVVYALHLPFNGLPLLRALQTDTNTTDPFDEERYYLSASTVAALVSRRNRLGVAMVRDMVAIGLRTYVFEAPRPFVGHNYVDSNQKTFCDVTHAFWSQTRTAILEVGAEVVPQPLDSLTEDGDGTLSRFSAGDGQHASQDFYLAQLQLLLSMI